MPRFSPTDSPTLKAPSDAIGLICDTPNGLDWLEPGVRVSGSVPLAVVTLGQVEVLMPSRLQDVRRVLASLNAAARQAE